TTSNPYLGDSWPQIDQELVMWARNLRYLGGVRSRIPAILTVLAFWTCIWAGPERALALFSDPPGTGQAAPANPVILPEGPFDLVPPLGVRLALVDGREIMGEATAWSMDALRGGFGELPWSDLRDSDRYRLLRESLRASGMDTLEGWMLVAINLQAFPSDPRYVRQAMQRVGRLAPADQRDAVVAQLEREVAKRRKAIEEAEAARKAQQLQADPAHRRAAGTADWPLPDSVLQEAEAARLRSKYMDLLDSLSMHAAEGVATIVYGTQPVRELAMFAVRLDSFHEYLASFFTAASTKNIFPGRALVILVSDDAQLRLLAAEGFRQAVPAGARGMLLYDGDTPVILYQPGAGRTQDQEELSRLLALAFLQAHHSRRALPPWLESGLADVLAAQATPKSVVDDRRRPRALDMMRNGRHPGWVLSIEADDPAIWPDGPARDLAFVLVTRLLETDAPALSGLVGDLKRGTAFDEAFRRRFGVTPRGFVDDSATWFRFND
ncbi:MAG: hypothetical protein MK085_10885, partial [Phycisphaerales bacterium]|nr:hypothetical protein [Phycisphaerales bacterium]